MSAISNFIFLLKFYFPSIEKVNSTLKALDFVNWQKIYTNNLVFVYVKLNHIILYTLNLFSPCRLEPFFLLSLLTSLYYSAISYKGTKIQIKLYDSTISIMVQSLTK